MRGLSKPPDIQHEGIVERLDLMRRTGRHVYDVTFAGGDDFSANRQEQDALQDVNPLRAGVLMDRDERAFFEIRLHQALVLAADFLAGHHFRHLVELDVRPAEQRRGSGWHEVSSEYNRPVAGSTRGLAEGTDG